MYRLSKKKTLEKTKLICEKEKIKITQMHPNHYTHYRYFTDYRKHMRQLFKEDSSESKDEVLNVFIKILKLNKEENRKRKNEICTSLNKKMNIIAWFNISAFIKLGVECLHDSDPYTIAIGIMTLTGRRNIEVLKTGYFEQIDGDQTHLIFKGQTKKGNIKNSRTKHRERNSKKYKIPCLAPSYLIISALIRLRSLLKFSRLSNVQINQRFNQRFKIRLEIFRKIVNLKGGFNTLNCRSLRSMYSMSAFEVFKRYGIQTYNSYISQILGHARYDLNTANCYTCFKGVNLSKLN